MRRDENYKGKIQQQIQAKVREKVLATKGFWGRNPEPESDS